MAEDGQLADPFPSPILTQDIPEGLLRHGGVPDEEVLAEVDVGVEDGEGEEQLATVVEGDFARHVLEVATVLEVEQQPVGRDGRHPHTAGEIDDAIHGREELVLEGFH